MEDRRIIPGRNHTLKTPVENLMEQREVSIPCGHAVVSEPEDDPINERAARLGPDWEFKPSDMAWVSNYRDWTDVFRDLLNLVNKPLNLLKRWFGS